MQCHIPRRVLKLNFLVFSSLFHLNETKWNAWIVWTAERIASYFYLLCVFAVFLLRWAPCLVCQRGPVSTTSTSIPSPRRSPDSSEHAQDGQLTHTHKYFYDAQIPIWAFSRRLLQICCDLSAFFNTHWQNCFSLRVSLTASLAPVFLSVGINRFHSHGRSPVPVILQRHAAGRPHPLHLLNQTLQFSPCTALTC